MHCILHVMVIGFHHKRGCQVEYCYPPLGDNVIPDPDKDIPEQWAFLPTLALPDGVHNVNEDCTYFLLPSLENPNQAVFGISCYRQIAAKDLVNKDEDVTRSSVQKCVCVISRVPLYGALKAKLELITQTYFNEKDFSKVDVLHQMHSNLCDMFDAQFIDSLATEGTELMSVPLQALFNTFKHRTLLLFKLLLLERRVMFDIFPVHFLGDIMLGLVSLFPRLLDEGLFEAAAYSVRRFPVKKEVAEVEDIGTEVTDIEITFPQSVSLTPVNSAIQIGSEATEDESSGAFSKETTNCRNPSSLKTDDYGFPLSIFTKGSLFHPYLSISYLDMIRSDSTRAYCIGVTNAIFRTRREMVDVIVTVDEKNEGQIEILSPELKRQLTLSTPDLRFIDFLCKMREMTVDPTLWDGSDDWLRLQFHDYLVSMLATAQSENSESVAEFNEEFIAAWRTKHNYRVWSCGEHGKMADATAAHPFAGQLGVNDVFLRMGHTFNSSEQGRKMMSTLSSTGKYVSETGSRFKSSLSSWMRGPARKPEAPETEDKS